jgi:hypothetical protein
LDDLAGLAAKVDCVAGTNPDDASRCPLARAFNRAFCFN